MKPASRASQNFVRGVEADERRSGCSGAVLGHLESGAIGVIDKLGRQQERHGERRAGGELGDLAQAGRVGVFGEVHGDVGLNRHESRHSVARVIFHGNEGQPRQPYRDGQEDQLGALGFALKALVLWNAQYLDDAIAQLRATGHQITDEDLRRLSPLQHEHIKCSALPCRRSARRGFPLRDDRPLGPDRPKSVHPALRHLPRGSVRRRSRSCHGCGSGGTVPASFSR